MEENRKSYHWEYWGLSLIMFFGILLVLAYHPDVRVENQFKLQFAKNSIELNGYLKSGEYLNLTNSIIIDFLFIITYITLFYLSIQTLSRRIFFFNSRIILIGALLPGILDLIENISLLFIIGYNQSFILFFIATRLKWVFVMPWVIIVIVLCVYQLLVGIDKLYCKLQKHCRI